MVPGHGSGLFVGSVTVYGRGARRKDERKGEGDGCSVGLLSTCTGPLLRVALSTLGLKPTSHRYFYLSMVTICRFPFGLVLTPLKRPETL